MAVREGQRFDEEGRGLFGDLPFLVTAAHELKSPLSLVRQLALGLEREDIDVAEKERMIRQIILTSERALRLSTDLTRTSRLQETMFELEPLNPQQVCEDVAHELMPLYQARGRTLRVTPHRRSLLVVANRDLLRRIMLNFGDNALHYASSDQSVEISTHVQQSGSRVRLGVRDYGPAVSQDSWRNLTESIGHNMQSMHNRPQSSGLGLYIAGQFAAAMHGRIGATRHRDGATFYVDIDTSSQLSLL